MRLKVPSFCLGFNVLNDTICNFAIRCSRWVIQFNTGVQFVLIIHFQADKIINSRAGRMIDYILLSPEPDGFERLCVALARDYGWLSKELELDLKIERGEIHIDEDVLKEAAMLVHRYG